MGEKGFTFIELMMVLVIFAIMMAIAFPSFEGWTVGSRLKTQANSFRQALVQARHTAINRGQRVTVCKTDNQSTCNSGAEWEKGWIMFVDGDEDGAKDGSEVLLKVGASMPNNYNLREGGNLSNWVAFDPSGEPAGSGGLGNGTFRLCGPDNDASQGWKIVVNNIGRVRVEEGAGGCP